jgi:alpha-tubulin suppressor-like RCC1 family protein
MLRVLVLAFAGSIAIVACGGSKPAPATAPENAPPPEEKPEPAQAGPPAEVDCGDYTTCGVTEGGQARCWGRDKEGELGDGGGQDKGATVVPGLGKTQKVVLAARFGCALVEGGKVKCWGTGRIANDGKPYTNAKPVVVADLDGVEEVSASGTVACARAGTKITCWGPEKPIGAPPPGSYKQVAAGFSHACALDAAGAVVCWGAAEWGDKGAFAKPAIKDAKTIVTGDRHACVITKDKKVACWGNNDAGQLGTKPDADPHKKPMEVSGLKDVAKLAGGEATTCAILGDGSARCWGANAEGELGLGKKSPDERPSKIAASGVAGLCLASSHGCALTKAAKIMCWGSNKHGQLGDGTKETQLKPVAVTW